MILSTQGINRPNPTVVGGQIGDCDCVETRSVAEPYQSRCAVTKEHPRRFVDGQGDGITDLYLVDIGDAVFAQ